MMEKREFGPRDRWLVASFIGGPSAWALHLNISYALVPESCERGTKLLLHATTIACLVVAIAAAAIAWRIRAADGQERRKWTAELAFYTCLTMIVVILAQSIPNVLLRSCQ
jgi:hypothetical protein